MILGPYEKSRFSGRKPYQGGSAQYKSAVAGISQFDEGAQPNPPFYHLIYPKHSLSAMRHALASNEPLEWVHFRASSPCTAAITYQR
jgi:hypothetical protein